MPEQFVNPSPFWTVERFLFFDFPCLDSIPVNPAILGAYRATTNITGGEVSSPNLNLAATATQLVYGAGGPPEPGLFPGGAIGLGTPPCQQGHPFMKEHPGPQPADPGSVDQIVDITHGLQVDHTARLSGSLVQFMANNSFESEVEISVLPVTAISVPAVAFPLAPVIVSPLAPQPLGQMDPNAWFWRGGAGPNADNELLFSAQVIIAQGGLPAVGFQEEMTYKLVYQWRFFYQTPGAARQRMPISGFDEAIAFQVTKL